MAAKTLIGKLDGAQTGPKPAIECFLPDKNANGGGVIIFPGGGYQHLAKHEGQPYAEYFNANGIAAFVVTYRLSLQGFKHPAMLEDALAAVNAVRGNAAELGVAPDKIGVMGSSAGGHLAAHTLVGHGRYESNVSLRPDFGILCYPAITMGGEYSHKGCRTNLLGENPPEALIDEVSLQKQITPQTPPCFLWHTADDPVVPVEHSIMFAAALRKQGVPFELHVYQHGRHGLGLNTGLPWASECLRWLKELLSTR